MSTLDLDTNRIEKVLSEYRVERPKGMDAGHIAEKLGLPLKEVVSILIQKDILKGEEIDFELIRVLLRKNPRLNERIIAYLETPSEVLDSYLVTQNEELGKAIRERYTARKLSPVFNSLFMFLFALNIPYNILVSILALLIGVLLSEFATKDVPESPLQVILGALNEV